MFSAGFYVRAVICDNHSVNVSAFSLLKKAHSPSKSTKDLYIYHVSSKDIKIYLFYDSVHLLKNIRNNLLGRQRFIFPAFSFDGFPEMTTVSSGEITWGLLYSLYDTDNKLQANLRKAPKLTYETLHPGHKKQNVQLALNIFEETTIAALKSYYPQRNDAIDFLKVIHSWWTISNSKTKYNTHNKLGNASIIGDNKPEFFKKLADWLTLWQESQLPGSQKFTLTKQTSSALITTLQCTAALIEDLLNEEFQYVLTARFQSDPLERRFSLYRQMSGGRFLVSLIEVINSEKILSLKSLLKANINFSEEDIFKENSVLEEFVKLRIDIVRIENELQEYTLSKDSEDVAVMIAGYIARKIRKKIECDICKENIVATRHDQTQDNYIKLLSRGGLLTPSTKLANYVCRSFAILDMTGDMIIKHVPNSVRDAGNHILSIYNNELSFSCDSHMRWSYEFVNRIITNIFFNNKQKLTNSQKRKDEIKDFKSRQLRKM